jgi:hypothetical protein
MVTVTLVTFSPTASTRTVTRSRDPLDALLRGPRGPLRARAVSNEAVRRRASTP